MTGRQHRPGDVAPKCEQHVVMRIGAWIRVWGPIARTLDEGRSKAESLQTELHGGVDKR